MSEEHTAVSVKILDKTYKIRCAQSQAQALQKAALLLDSRMREVRDGGQILGLDRIAIISALNLAYELLNQSRQKTAYLHTVSDRIRHLQERIQGALHQQDEIFLESEEQHA